MNWNEKYKKLFLQFISLLQKRLQWQNAETYKSLHFFFDGSFWRNEMHYKNNFLEWSFWRIAVHVGCDILVMLQCWKQCLSLFICRLCSGQPHTTDTDKAQHIVREAMADYIISTAQIKAYIWPMKLFISNRTTCIPSWTSTYDTLSCMSSLVTKEGHLGNEMFPL